MKKFLLILKTSCRNWTTLLYFEIFYKTFGFTVVFPFLRYLLSILPRLSGADYLGQENITLLFFNPLALLTGLGILILAAIYITYEILAFILLCEAGWHYERMTVPMLIRRSAAKSFALLRLNKIGVFTILLLLTFSVFSPMSGYLKLIRFPDFLLAYITENAAFFTLYAGILISFHIQLFLYLFGLPAMFLSDKSFPDSWKESLALLRGRKLRTAGTVLALNLCFLLLLSVFILALFLGFGLYTKLLYIEGGQQRLEILLTSWQNIAVIVCSALASTFLWGTIVVLYHQYHGEQLPKSPAKKLNLKRILFHMVSITALVSLLQIFTETEISGSVLPPIESRPLIIAHRAGAFSAPENTILALGKAVEAGSDGAEIDVQQLGDGTLIVMHDSNFKRTAGLNLDVWDADYPMIQNLDAGAGFSPKGSPEPIPTLEDFLQSAKGTCKLMLELKATGHETEIESQVLSLIQKYGMEDECMIASMDLSILRKVKELDPDMETVYISALLITDQYDLNFVDGYSVESTALSRGMTVQAHFQNKKIYVWTVNSDHSIKKGLECGVDGLIADKPQTAYMAVTEYGDYPLVKSIVNLFY